MADERPPLVKPLPASGGSDPTSDITDAVPRMQAAPPRMEEQPRSLRTGTETRAIRGGAAIYYDDGMLPSVKCGSALTLLPRTRVYYDASLIISHGMETAVGMVRVDHYVADFLADDPAIDLRFVIFDAARGAFRGTTRRETDQIRGAIGGRRTPAATAARAGSPGAPEMALLELAPAELAHLPEPEHVAARERITAEVLLRRLRVASTLPAREFDPILIHYAARLLPVTSRQSLGARLATRVVRGLALFGARCGHFAVFQLSSAALRIRDAGRYLVRPDPVSPGNAPEPGAPEQDHPRHATPHTAIAAAGGSAAAWLDGGPEPVPDLIGFENGSVLLSMGNTWDYLDYAYLHRICTQDQVRFVSVIYDVIAMQFPFTTPSPAHLYHRHWVEIGHCASHLLALSKFSADQYRAFIGEPNGLSPRLSYAHIPNFLRKRADEIAEIPVVQLLGHSFVLFCATIEIRKNHQLLLQLWDRLRLEFRDGELPILVLAGKWGWGTETVRSLAERNFRLRHRLLILESVSDAELIWLYRRARFTVFPSLSEGYGLGAAESLSFGTPVVIADCPALVEATEGLMPAYDPLDFLAWLDEMRRLIRDDVRLDELRAAASRYGGPSDETFAAAIREIACSVSRPAGQSDACM